MSETTKTIQLFTRANINRVFFAYRMTNEFKSPTEPFFSEKWENGNRNKIIREYNALKFASGGCYTAIQIKFREKTIAFKTLVEYPNYL